MPVKGNQFRSNNFKEENLPRQSSKTERERKSPKKENSLPFNIGESRVIKILGLFSLLLALYFFVAFTSYLFTWQDDQSYVSAANGGWHNLFKTTQELMENGVKNPVVQNWLGKFGALLSNQFIFEWFGIASFLFVFVFFIIGYRLLFKIRLFSIGKTLAYSFFCLVFISIFLGFAHAFVADTPNYLEGGFGYWSNRLLDAQIGQTGTGGILIFAALTMLVIVYNIDFKLPKLNKTVEAAAPGDVFPEPVDLEDEDISLPVEWPGREKSAANIPRHEALAAQQAQDDLFLPIGRPPFHFGGRAGGASSRATRSFHRPRHNLGHLRLLQHVQLRFQKHVLPQNRVQKNRRRFSLISVELRGRNNVYRVLPQST